MCEIRDLERGQGSSRVWDGMKGRGRPGNRNGALVEEGAVPGDKAGVRDFMLRDVGEIGAE